MDLFALSQGGGILDIALFMTGLFLWGRKDNGKPSTALSLVVAILIALLMFALFGR